MINHFLTEQADRLDVFRGSLMIESTAMLMERRIVKKGFKL